MEIKANSPALKSWIDIKPDSDFSIQNLPFGVYSDKQVTHHACIAIGDQLIDLHIAHHLHYFKGLSLPENIFANQHLNDFISLGKEVTRKVRDRVSELLSSGNTELQNSPNKDQIFKKQSSVQMLMPVHIGDYTDFYSSIDHATNVGKMFRDPENALLPNWKHLPVGYHGRASSICVSGHSFHRPKGQMKPTESPPGFGACKLVDWV